MVDGQKFDANKIFFSLSPVLHYYRFCDPCFLSFDEQRKNIFWKAKQPGHEDDYAVPSNAVVSNKWNSSSFLHTALFVDAKLRYFS